jgi:hypothetical protein
MFFLGLFLVNLAILIVPFAMFVYALITGTGPWYVSLTGMALYIPFFYMVLRCQLNGGIRTPDKARSEPKKPLGQQIREALSVVRGLRVLLLSGRAGKNAFLRRCGGSVSTIARHESNEIVIEPTEPALQSIRGKLVDLEKLFSRITGFDHVRISDLTIAVFKNRTNFRALFIRLGLPGWNPAGFYAYRRYRGTVCLIDEVLPAEWQAQRIVTHEVTHSLQFQCRPAFRDDWFLEGLAEYCTLALLS